MNHFTGLLLAAALLMPLSACEREVEETVFDDQIEALDKAREVEDKLMERAGQIGRELEEEEQEKRPH